MLKVLENQRRKRRSVRKDKDDDKQDTREGGLDKASSHLRSQLSKCRSLSRGREAAENGLLIDQPRGRVDDHTSLFPLLSASGVKIT